MARESLSKIMLRIGSLMNEMMLWFFGTFAMAKTLHPVPVTRSAHNGDHVARAILSRGSFRE